MYELYEQLAAQTLLYDACILADQQFRSSREY